MYLSSCHLQRYYLKDTGIQKIDEMTEGVKGKLIGGRILFEQTALAFNLPVFTPTRNIEFTVKIFETKPNEQ